MVAILVAGKRTYRWRRNAGEVDVLVRPGVEHGATEHFYILGDGDILDVEEGIERVVAQPTHGLWQVNLGGVPLLVGCITIGSDYDVLFFSDGNRFGDVEFFGIAVAAVDVVPLCETKIVVEPEAEVYSVYLHCLCSTEVPCAHVGLHSCFYGVAHLCTHSTARCYQHDGKHNEMLKGVAFFHNTIRFN